MDPIQESQTRYVGWRGKAMRREVVVIFVVVLAIMIGGGVWTMLDKNTPRQTGSEGPPVIAVPRDPAHSKAN